MLEGFKDRELIKLELLISLFLIQLEVLFELEFINDILLEVNISFFLIQLEVLFKLEFINNILLEL